MLGAVQQRLSGPEAAPVQAGGVPSLPGVAVAAAAAAQAKEGGPAQRACILFRNLEVLI